MALATSFLESSTWAGLPVNILHPWYPDDESVVPASLEPEDSYRPVGLVPASLVYRTSDREKRLEAQLTGQTLMSGIWGTLHEVVGGGSHVGFVVDVNGPFCGAHVLPDMVHLVGCISRLHDDSVVKDLFDHKTFRMFLIGASEDATAGQDLVITTKTRWFRNRNNPKHLGFSKDER